MEIEYLNEDKISFQYDEFHQLPPPGSSLGWVSIHTLHTYEHNFGQTTSTQNVCPEFFVAFKEAATERGW
jgi:hypothetical protein